MRDGQLSEEEFMNLEKLPTRDELLAKIVGQLHAATSALPTLLSTVPT